MEMRLTKENLKEAIEDWLNAKVIGDRYKIKDIKKTRSRKYMLNVDIKYTTK